MFPIAICQMLLYDVLGCSNKTFIPHITQVDIILSQRFSLYVIHGIFKTCILEVDNIVI